MGQRARKIHALYDDWAEAWEIFDERFWDCWGRWESACEHYGSMGRPDPVWGIFGGRAYLRHFFCSGTGPLQKTGGLLDTAFFHLYHLSFQRASLLKGSWEVLDSPWAFPSPFWCLPGSLAAQKRAVSGERVPSLEKKAPYQLPAEDY